MFQNQLKLNLNAVVDNINLVNVGRKPEPILINKTSKFNNFSRDPDRNVNFNVQPSFEYIDEEKLSMYAFLAKRELKSKEWLAKDCENNDNRENHLNESVISNSKPPARKPSLNGLASTTGSSKAFSKNLTVSSKSSTINTGAGLDSVKVGTARSLVNSHRSEQMPNSELEFSEMKKCYLDTVKSFEFLQKQLNECKLSVVGEFTWK